MTRVLSKRTAEQIVSPEDLEQVQLARREEAALLALRSLRFRVTIHTPRAWREADPLLGIAEGWTQGECYAVAHSVDGRRRAFSGISACQVLADAQSWLRYQSNVEPPMRFEIADGFRAVPVRQQIAGDTTETKARRENSERRIVSFAGGTAHLVDVHGSPLKGDADSRASQLA